jgi:nitric oxide dioxygenase
VLLSGGVGLTPMVSILEAISVEYPELETHFVHAALNSQTHAMDRHVRSLAADHGRATVKTFYSEPHADDAVGLSHDHDGFVTVDWLKQNTPFETADFYLCGPKGFLAGLVPELLDAGIHPDRIHYEFFGPTTELMAA